jgi:hypothetical protein
MADRSFELGRRVDPSAPRESSQIDAETDRRWIADQPHQREYLVGGRTKVQGQ